MRTVCRRIVLLGAACLSLGAASAARADDPKAPLVSLKWEVLSLTDGRLDWLPAAAAETLRQEGILSSGEAGNPRVALAVLLTQGRAAVLETANVGLIGGRIRITRKDTAGATVHQITPQRVDGKVVVDVEVTYAGKTVKGKSRGGQMLAWLPGGDKGSDGGRVFIFTFGPLE